MSQACGEPSTLIDALIAQGRDIGGLSAFIATSFSGHFTPETADSFALSSMGAIGVLRNMTKAGKLAVIPCHIGQIGPMISDGTIACDVAFVQVSPADANGNHSYGLVNDHTQAAVAKARTVIAEVNDQVPFTYCDAYLPSSKIDCAVHVSRMPVEVSVGALSETDQAIAKHVAAYIEDGSVIQVGVGAVPDAILRLLLDRRDLGIHSGMVGDGLVDLIEAGVVTNSRKEIDAGITITGALIGSRRLFQFADRNSALKMHRAAYTHSEAILTSLSRLITINSALEVDLSGQVNAEQSGSAYLGGTGGQVDYVRAGSRSPGGHSVIALPSTAKGGAISRITTALSGPVTTSRSEVDIICTEYGAAELKGKSIGERARRLTAIAHPDFRDELDRAAFELAKRGF
jgi:acyl-CoA hydrolase